MRGSTDWWPMFPVEAFRATLEKFHGIVEACGLRYHLTGGVVGNALDEPRMTQDIDIVIDIDIYIYIDTSIYIYIDIQLHRCTDR